MNYLGVDKGIIDLYLVSDSSGETVITIGRAVLTRFSGIKVRKHIWSMIRTRSQVDNLVAHIRETSGIVLYTFADVGIIQYLLEQCAIINVPCISALDAVVAEVEKCLNLKAERRVPGGQYSNLDESYFEKISAIDFTLRHDDGQAIDDIASADIVLVGVSRTSKTPTCLYLAQRGYKAANIPFVAKKQLSIDPDLLKDNFVVAFTISPERLKIIRQNRLMGVASRDVRIENYYDDYEIRNELKEAIKLYSKHKWPIIDVSGKAIEETAGEIINFYREYLESKGIDLSST